MRLLILGGTQFLGREIAIHAVESGHDVTCAARGIAGAAPPQARFLRVDRNRPDGLAQLSKLQFDAAIDVSRHPSQVRNAVATLKEQIAHWTFVSSTSVYADTSTRGQKADEAALVAPTASDIQSATESNYAAAKVACERAVGTEAFICRPGLIVGPGDPTGRFAYWVSRVDRGGEVLVPKDPDDPVQLIDVRDLARWIVSAAQTRLVGCFDGIGPSWTRREFLEECMDAIGSPCGFTWVDRAFLARHEIREGSGPRSLPLPMPDSVGDNSRDIAASLAAGLAPRPLSQTVRDTLMWLERGGTAITGLTADEESAALRAWHDISP